MKKGIDHLKDNSILFVSDKDRVEVSKINTSSYFSNVKNVDLQSEYTILFVEDDDEMREYLKHSFMDKYKIRTAINGNEALYILKNDEISIVVCDVMMPEMDGLEFCRLVKNDLAISHIPLILLTALSDEDNMIAGLTNGADDYLFKPFNNKHLELKIKNILLLKKKMRDSFKLEFMVSNKNELNKEVNTIDSKFLEKVTLVLDKYISEQEINIEKISADVGISRIHLYRKIKEITGFSTSEFFKVYKIKKSLPLLLSNNLNISEIAFQCGFSSPAYFSKCFKEIMNISPTDYQLNNKESS